jgi:hypothetical protein
LIRGTGNWPDELCRGILRSLEEDQTALYAFDRTGNDDRDDTDEGGWDSNVLHFFRAFQDPGKDFVEGRDTGSLYLKGIGRRGPRRIPARSYRGRSDSAAICVSAS